MCARLRATQISLGAALPYTNRAARWPVHFQCHALRRSDTRIETLHAASDVEVGHRQRVLLDELAARFDLVTHQRGEDFIRRQDVLDAHLHEPARRRVDGGIPELLGVHLAEALVTLDRLALARLVDEPGHGLLERTDFF